MKAKEIVTMSPADIEQKVVELKLELSKERASIVSGTRSENPGKVKKLRRDIARLLTIKKQKEGKESAGN
ncbi:MAG: 50S ribosomal protein L29 [Candidatus Diapherotrites archaeon]|uniref:Large ribosomal subunit protein uL29 n=1 Tax=Candidatus Iainarchaeum sp. TaxID=3101447 RepID=A0A8T5GFY7_9ARCH|nr:50S ribosomal protein L29 [Candidatus Diapherotrites archaeon]MBT7241605.1 50S ribosomal protein L29 [Candidatus Diapherotrites archaeon]